MGQIVARRVAGYLFGGGIWFVTIEIWQARRDRRFGFQVRQERQRHGEIVETRIVVVADIGADPFFPPPLFPACFIAEVDVIIEAVPTLPRPRFPVGPALAKRFFQFIAFQIQRAEVKFLHIGERGVTGVIHDDIKQHAYTAPMGLINQLSKVGFVAHVGVKTGPVLGVVTVIGVVGKVAFGAAADPAVNLLQR